MREDKLEAFDRLCREEYEGLVRTAYLITGDREEAADLVQEALVRAFERWKVVEGLDRPGAWLQRVTSNLAVSWRRRQGFRALGRVPDRPDSGPEVGGDVELLHALSFLTPAQRAAVVLRYYADQSVEQTARALGKRPGTIRALTSQGLSRLREFLQEAEGARH